MKLLKGISEMQITSATILNLVTDSISNDDNRYAECDS